MTMRKNAAIVLSMACGLMLLATGASANLVQTNLTADPGYQYEPISTDLINNGQASLDSVAWSGYDSPPYQEAPLSALIDGTAGAAGAYSGTMVTMDGRSPSGIFFLKGSSTGYDITEINSYSCWYAPRNMQKYQVYYSTTSDPAYASGDLPHQLGEFAYTDMLNESQIIGTKISLTDTAGKLLSGVNAIQFKFLDAGTGYGDPVNPDSLNRTAYREIDVLGSATVPEPSAMMLIVCGVVSVVAYAWSSRK